MESLHRQGIIKASNVLIEPSAILEFTEESYRQVKLCNVGMASLRLSSFRCEDSKGTSYSRAPQAFPFPDEKLLQESDTLNEYTIARVFLEIQNLQQK
ncbi:hypothetical protein SUGI_0994840 [Cryptomeria japonica]|nr:hypothetical protein SUGI_0994840 [Cryptomeria japonica]